MYLNPPYHIEGRFIDQFLTIHKQDYIKYKIKHKKSQKLSSMRLSKLPERFLQYANECKLKIEKNIQKNIQIYCV